jgi:predicted nucleotidyltransferase
MTTIAERTDCLEKALDRMVAVLVKAYRPEKIILFGSFASGLVHEGSDLDLVIIKETPKRPIDRQVEVYGLVKPEVGLDLFVYTPQEFRDLESMGFSLVREMVTNGKVLYEARNPGMAQDRA